MIDLTKITEPFGLLDASTQKDLRAYAGEMERFGLDGWADTHYPSYDRIRVYRAKPFPLTKPNIPWAYIDKEWQFAARDKDGGLELFSTRPEASSHYWSEESSGVDVSNIFDCGTCHWKHSLVERPKGI